MIAKLFLFAAARDIVGAGEVELKIDDNGTTVADLKQQLTERYPGLEELLKRSKFAVNQQFVSDDALIPQNAEIGLIPPVSGG